MLRNFSFSGTERTEMKKKERGMFWGDKGTKGDNISIYRSHILRITNKMENTMVKIQHWKIYAVYYGKENSELSKKIIELVTLQCSYEGCGMPISHECLNTCLSLPSE